MRLEKKCSSKYPNMIFSNTYYRLTRVGFVCRIIIPDSGVPPADERGRVLAPFTLTVENEYDHKSKQRCFSKRF